MMYGPEESDPVIVATKLANKAEQLSVERSAGEPYAAEPVERRAGTKGNAGQQSTLRTQSRINVSQALERIRKVAVTHPRWEPYAGKPHVRICAGGGEQSPSLPRTVHCCTCSRQLLGTKRTRRPLHKMSAFWVPNFMMSTRPPRA